jgi:hypothetical protein
MRILGRKAQAIRFAAIRTTLLSSTGIEVTSLGPSIHPDDAYPISPIPLDCARCEQ